MARWRRVDPSMACERRPKVRRRGVIADQPVFLDRPRSPREGHRSGSSIVDAGRDGIVGVNWLELQGEVPQAPDRRDPFGYFNGSPEMIRLAVMMYVRCTLGNPGSHCPIRRDPGSKSLT